jgi:hypothetical protein
VSHKSFMCIFAVKTRYSTPITPRMTGAECLS